MPRRILLIIAGAALLVILAVAGFLLWQRRQASPGTNTANTNGTVPNVNTVVLNTNQATNTNSAGGPVDAKTAVQELAKSFASIYGSFSTQNNFQNITDLYFYMTPALRAQQETFVAGEQAKQTDTSLYKGTTSETRVTTVEAFDEAAGTADVRVTLQRTETSGTTSEPSTYFQDIVLSFQRLDGAWKVGRIAWQAKQ